MVKMPKNKKKQSAGLVCQRLPAEELDEGKRCHGVRGHAVRHSPLTCEIGSSSFVGT